MPFTDEQRAKGIETRKRNAEQRRLKKQNQVTGVATTEVSASKDEVAVFNEENIQIISDRINTERLDDIVEFDWHTSPLPEAVDRLAKMKQEYERAAQIVLQRQSKVPVVWTCWTQFHKDVAPKAAIAQCKKTIPDGRWASIDNGVKDAEGNYAPEVTCSMLCYQSRSEYRSKILSRVHVRQ
jgi:hypothetical protein